MRPGRILGRLSVVMMLTSLLASPAWAIRCKEWTPLDEAGRREALASSVTAILESDKAKRFTSINRPKIERCMRGSVTRIEDDFDNACSKGQRVSMNALDEILLNYVRSCAG